MKKGLAVIFVLALALIGGFVYASRAGWLSWNVLSHNLYSLRSSATRWFMPSYQDAATTSTLTQAFTFDEAHLKNLVIELNGYRIQLKDGEGIYVVRREVMPADPRMEDGKGEVYEVTSAVYTDHLAFGDLDHDGKDDAIMVLRIDAYEGGQTSEQKAFVILQRPEGPQVRLSNAVRLMGGDEIKRLSINGDEVVFDLSISRRGTPYDEKIPLSRVYRFVDGTLVAQQPLTVGEERPLLELLRHDPEPGQLISPDGEWMLAFHKSGSVPLSRSVNYYLVLHNLKGKADRYIYLDWSLRPEDENTEAYPLGWSADGRYVYLSFFRPLKSKETAGPFKGYRHPMGGVAYIDLDSRHSYWNYMITPPGVTAYTGSIMDALPGRGMALWHEGGEGKATTTLTLFPMVPRSASSTTKILELPASDRRMVVSATIDRCKDQVGYVLHQPGKDDEVYRYTVDTKQRERVDLAPYRQELQKAGIASPYRVQIQKVWMCEDLILTITGSNDVSTVKRWRRAADNKVYFIQE